ncbi:MAG: hypothetical protein QXE04_02115, partial [Thermoplasmatales archaeon]
IKGEILALYKQMIKVRKEYLNCKRDSIVDKGDKWLIVKKGKIMIIYAFEQSTIRVNTNGRLILSSVPFPQELNGEEIKVNRGFGIYVTW